MVKCTTEPNKEALKRERALTRYGTWHDIHAAPIFVRISRPFYGYQSCSAVMPASGSLVDAFIDIFSLRLPLTYRFVH